MKTRKKNPMNFQPFIFLLRVEYVCMGRCICKAIILKDENQKNEQKTQRNKTKSIETEAHTECYF